MALKIQNSFFLLIFLNVLSPHVKAKDESFVLADSSRELRFHGVIEDIISACAMDGICHMKISGRTVIFGDGRMTQKKEPWGKILGMKFGLNYSGKKVLVYCRQQAIDYDKLCSLQGSGEYYIKLDD